jgi:hypothetical protein
VWTVHPQDVRVAATTCAEHVRAALPDLTAELDTLLSDAPPEPSADLRRADDLFHRVLDYLDARK